MSYTFGRTTSLMEGGLLSGATVVLTLFGVYIPISWIVVTIFQAFPILILVVRHGVKAGAIASVAAGILISLLGSPLAGLFFASMVPVALILGWSLKERKAPVLGLTLGSVAGFLAKIAIIGINLQFLGIDYLGLMESTMKATAAATIETLKAVGTSQRELALMAQSSEQAIPVFLVLLPGLFLVEAVFEAYVNLWLAGILLRKIGHEAEGFPSFDLWDFPKSFLYGWVLSFAAWNAGLHFFGVEALTYKIGLNVFVFFTIVLFLQGFAVISYYLKQRQVSRLLRVAVRLFLLIFMMVAPIVFFGIIYVGGADIFANFRRLQRRECK